MFKHVILLVCACSICLVTPLLAAEDSDSEVELAKQLQNPVANLISLPLQSNWDFGLGSEDATRYTLNVQPVIPFSLNERWNLITRTIVPIIHAEAPFAGGDDETGLGDILQSFFLSPRTPVNGWIVGAGPVLLYPTASETKLGTEKWSAGPTVVALRQQLGWTYGILANHLWSFAGEGSRRAVNASFFQPFLSFTNSNSTTFGVNTESSYDWQDRQWTVPINLSISQLLKVGQRPISLSCGGKYFAETPDGGPDWGVRLTLTFLFPK